MHYEFDSFSGGGAIGTPSHYTDKKIYVSGGGMEMEYKNGATGSTPTWNLKKVRIYIPAPGGNAGSAELDPNGTSASAHKLLVYHYEHLGSIQAITNYGETAANVQFAADGQNRKSVYSYDPWGQRRDVKDWKSYPWGQSTTAPVYTWGWDNPTTTADEDDLIPRGFTGHEMMDDLGLIHMNGRIYDPRLGRFLSADQVVQAPLILQSYNRYSYCFNNPLGLVDPSGYEAEMTDAERERQRRAALNRSLTGASVQDVITDGIADGKAEQEESATQTTSGSAQATPPTKDEKAITSGAPTTEGDTKVDPETVGPEKDATSSTSNVLQDALINDDSISSRAMRLFMRVFGKEQMQFKVGWDIARYLGISNTISSSLDGFHVSNDIIIGTGECAYAGLQGSFLSSSRDGEPEFSISVMGGAGGVLLGATLNVDIVERSIDWPWGGNSTFNWFNFSGVDLFVGKGSGACGKIDFSGSTTIIGVDSDWNLNNLTTRGWFSEPVISDGNP